MATAQPAIRAQWWNQRVYRPITMAGKVCRIQIPPSSCRLIENVLLSASTKIRAPSLTTSETPLGDPGLLGGGGVGVEVFLVDVAGEQVRGRDRHDRRGHQR